MNILVLNGSPRQGNTVTAINAYVKGLSDEHQVEIVDTYKLSVAPCKGCNACGCANGCIDKDDTNMIVDKIVAADMVVFASPVYWWGITAQLKLVMDKCYCRGALLKGKKLGVVLVGGAETSDGQYDLIKQQFDYICEYLGWKMEVFEKYSASAKDDLAKQLNV